MDENNLICKWLRTRKSTLKRSWTVDCSNSFTDMSEQMATSSSDTTCWNLSHAKPSLLRRVIGLPLGGLDGVTSRGLDGSTSRIYIVDGCLAGARRTREPTLMTPDLDDPCLSFLWPWQLGRDSISIVLDRVFLFSAPDRQGWEWTSSPS